MLAYFGLNFLLVLVNRLAFRNFESHFFHESQIFDKELNCHIYNIHGLWNNLKKPTGG
jgi:hypothetical protein